MYTRSIRLGDCLGTDNDYTVILFYFYCYTDADDEIETAGCEPEENCPTINGCTKLTRPNEYQRLEFAKGFINETSTEVSNKMFISKEPQKLTELNPENQLSSPEKGRVTLKTICKTAAIVDVVVDGRIFVGTAVCFGSTIKYQVICNSS